MKKTKNIGKRTLKALHSFTLDPMSAGEIKKIKKEKKTEREYEAI